MPTAPAAPSTPTLLSPRHWLAIVLGFAALALAVMAWRWGGTVEDSLAYFNTARYLRGELPFNELRAPFPYRILVPALAAALPGELHNAFAALNWLLISGAAAVIALTAARLGFSRGRVVGAGLLLIVSVPTFWYAPYLLVDPGSILARAVFVLGILTGQPWLAAAAGIVGTAVREENILLLVWLLAMRRLPFAAALGALALAGGWIVALRWWLLPGLPSYTWTPSLQTLLGALGDVRSLASLATAALLVVPLAALGRRHAAAALRPLDSLLLLMILPPLYAALSVRVDGRIIWSLYPMLIPLALCVGLPRATPSAAPAAPAEPPGAARA
ncbi:MAG: hypothetical protein V4462_08015 [Pseudomonadota bacterium]